MITKFLMTAAALVFGLQLAAQSSCPKEFAENQPGRIEDGASQNCGSVTYSFGGVTVTTTNGGCPLFALITPPHQKAARTNMETMVQVTGTVPVTMHYFVCVTRYWLFIPIGTSCQFDRMVVAYSLDRLTTIPCPAPKPQS